MLKRRLTSTAWALSLLLLVAGCSKSESDGLLRESWDAFSIDGSRVGHAHTAYYRETVDGRPLVKVVVAGKVVLVRFGNRAEQTTSDTTWRTEEGAVSRFEITADLGESKHATTGTVSG